jgi:glycosyltransferase involved in cell wall biosynthesis
MKVALVHDYLNEAGGAERVLRVLADMFPGAPIYTAFAVPGSSADKMFSDRKIVTSWFQRVPFYNKLHSPLRFLIPWIWNPPIGGFDFSGFDLIITSSSWYVTKGFGSAPLHVKRPIEICYCHTPPRWLYGYSTSMNWQKYKLVRWYGMVVGHFLRIYDYKQAQKVDWFIANSKNVADRIKKFYRRDSVVVYPPVAVEYKSRIHSASSGLGAGEYKEGGYFLMVTRLVGGKGIELAVEAAKKYGFTLKIAGEKAGYATFPISDNEIYKNIEFLGRVDDEEKFKLMANAKAFFALAKDEDFGMTTVEAQLCGAPVIAFDGGGYKESVINDKTGILFDDYSSEGLYEAINKFNKMKWDKKVIKENAKKFSKERFKKDMQKIIRMVDCYLYA